MPFVPKSIPAFEEIVEPAWPVHISLPGPMKIVGVFPGNEENPA
jgi:hypothetical protein